MRRTGLWLMLGGILLFAVTLLSAGYLFHFVQLHAYAHGVTLIPLVLGAVGAVLWRRPAWLPSALAVAVGAALGAVGLVALFEPVSTPMGDTVMQRGVPGLILAGRAQSKARVEVDRSFLNSGLSAAESGQPLPAPEGGFLIPHRVDRRNNYGYPLRFVSTSRREGLDAIWRQALREQESETRKEDLDTGTPTDSPLPYLPVVATNLVWTILLAMGLNVLAAFAGRLEGKRK